MSQDMDANKIIFKHSWLPIPDMFCDISINHDDKIIVFKLDHFDSALVINAARQVETDHAPIRLIDNESKDTFGPARIKHLYELHVVFDERSYIARIMKLWRQDEFTIALTERSNQHETLDAMKWRISCEVVSRFSAQEIREQSKANLERWRSQGTWSAAYEEWLGILDSADDAALVVCMVGTSENSNRLRQSMPYVGMLDEQIVWRIKKGIP